MLGMAFGHAPVAATPQAVGPDGFGDGGFAAGTDRIVLSTLWSFLLASDPRLDLLQGLRQQDDVAATALGIASACLPGLADPAGRLGEQHGASANLKSQVEGLV